MNNRGITLVELLVAMGIIGILLVVLAFNYQNWMGRYNVEKAVKDMYSDLMFAKTEAVMKDRAYIADFQSNTSYRIWADINGDADVDAGETLPTFPKTLPYTIYAYSYNGPDVSAVMTSKTITSVVINFDNRGRISSPVLLVDPENPVDTTTNKVITGVISLTSGPTDYVGKMQADYDCITLSPTKINIGQMQGGLCNVK